MISPPKIVNTLVSSVIAFYGCLILYNMMIWLPVHFERWSWPDYALPDIFFYFPGFFAGLRRWGDRLIPQVWEVFAAPTLIVVTGAFTFRKLQRRPRIFVTYFILLASMSLMSFLVGLIVNDLGHWFGDSASRSWILLALRVLSSILVALLIALPNSLAFYRLFTDLHGSWSDHLVSFACRFLIPSAIVTWSAVLQLANIWSPFHKSPPRWEWMTFEGWQLIFLPVISICLLATFSAIFWPRLSARNHLPKLRSGKRVK